MSEIKELPIENIIPDYNQPRKNFDKNKLQELAESIKQYGDPIEEAETYARMINDLKYTHKELAKKINKSSVAGFQAFFT